MRILFVGESWQGSCARSLKESLDRHRGISLDEVNEDLFIPKPRTKVLRAANKFLRPLFRAELQRQIVTRIETFRPDVVAVYKGNPIAADWINEWKSLGALTVNIYPDYSPHAYGAEHRTAVGVYDLVISTKPFHEKLWSSVYGYSNRCVFVPQGYDPLLHLDSKRGGDARFDVSLVATWRPEYGSLMQALGKALANRDISVFIGGNGWAKHRNEYPSSWTYGGPQHGRAYLESLHQGKIVVAPVTREVVIDGHKQPGDEDTTRTYELAAAQCFFIHRRTEYVQQLYDGASEVPMFDTADELAEKILYYLARPKEREEMALAAHRRAVPAYALDTRAAQIFSILSDALSDRQRWRAE